jgi:diadenylate cyclase
MQNLLTNFSFVDILDVIIVYYIVYRVLLFIRGTRSIQMAIGIGILIIVFSISYFLNLYTVQWIFSNFIDTLIIIIIIIFADDIRRALSSVGKNPFLKNLTTLQSSKMIDEIIKATQTFSTKKIGALIVLERKIGLKNYLEIGTVINSDISAPLICSIFMSKESHLHDGAIIIQDGRITAAGCFLPLTLRSEVPKELGTRHRAAIGITEETDAVVIVVSEQKGHVSVAMGGDMIKNLNHKDLRSLLGRLFSVQLSTKENLYTSFESLKEAEEGK